MRNTTPLLLVSLVAVCALSSPWGVHGQAALRVIDGPTPLVADGESHFIHPRWSPDGSQLAFTNESYRGIWISTESGTGVTQISDDRSAGFGFSWSPDGSAILTRVARFEGRRRADAVKLLEIAGRSERLLTEYRESMPVLPQWSRDAAHVVLHDQRQLEVIAVDAAAGKTVSTEPLLITRGERVAVANPGAGTLADVDVAPQGQPLNLVQSPNGNLAAFEILGGNLFVISADGTTTVDLGRGYRPQWSPDSEWVVFMRTEDDGHVITSSDLFAARADGSSTVQLTDTRDALEMNPVWSPDGSRIAFDDRGMLFELGVSY